MRKIALITGATSGIGLSYAKYYASKGYDLIITGRRAEIIKKNAQELENKYKIIVQVYIIDLANLHGIQQFLSKIASLEIDVLVNNAGFGLKPSFVDLDEIDIDDMLYLHVWCVTKLIHYVLPGMKERNCGTIINISSDGAFAVMPKNVLYSSTKLYIMNLTEGLYMELSDTNIHVQVVCPGFVDSHFHENARMHVDKNKKGLFGFRKADDIVSDAVRDLEKGKVVSIPDKTAKGMRFFIKFIPRNHFYKMAIAFSSKFLEQK